MSINYTFNMYYLVYKFNKYFNTYSIIEKNTYMKILITISSTFNF